MAVGSLLTLIGYHFGNIENNSANAQLRKTPQETEIVDEIKCRKLVIVGKDDTSRITLETSSLDRGQITIYNEDNVERVFLGVADNHDIGFLLKEALQINKDGERTVRLGTNDHGGYMTLNSTVGIGTKITVRLGTDDHGGYMALWNKVIDKPVIQACVNNKGEGIVFTRDKAGYETWSAPRGMKCQR